MSVTGEQLSDIYLGNRRGLELERHAHYSQNRYDDIIATGGVWKIRQIEVLDERACSRNPGRHPEGTCAAGV